MQSSLDGLYSNEIIDSTYSKYCINTNVNTWDKFIESAIIIQQESNGTFSYISNRADTFFVKKRVEFSAPLIK